MAPRNTPIHLEPQDMNISAPAGSPDPNDPCHQGDPANSYQDLIASHQNGIRLARFEPLFNRHGGPLGALDDNVFVRYTDEVAHVVYLDRGQNLKGFRLSVETFHKELAAGRGSIVTRVRRIGANLPQGQLNVFDGLNTAMDFLNWPDLRCNPIP